MEIKLYDSELKVMEILWREGKLAAGGSGRHSETGDRLEQEYDLYGN
ncbi:hypothetical protein ACFSQ7_21110 [Paenibacillus rhizoplanae]